MDTSRLKSPLAVLGIGLLLGLIADLMLYGQPPGISVPIIAALSVAALVALAKAEAAPVVKANLWLIAPVLFLAAMSAVRAAPLLRFLNLSGAILLTLLLANRLAGRPLADLDLSGLVGALLESVALGGALSFAATGRALAELRERRTVSGTLPRRLLVGGLLALPFLAVFTALFASADPIFGDYVGAVFGRFNLPDLFGHLILTIVLAGAATGWLAYALTRDPSAAGWLNHLPPPHRNQKVDPDPSPAAADGVELSSTERPAAVDTVRVPGLLGMLEAGVVLFSVDALFLAFVLIQAAALFGGQRFLERHHLTYAEYARRGFFQLLAVSIITLCLILALDYLTGRVTPRERRLFIVGGGLMIAQTVLILVSAFQRLALYEWAYGFTRLRVHSHVFMIWLAVLLMYFLALMAINRSRLFATGLVIVSLGFVTTLNVLNPDAFITRQNITRYRGGAELDVAYLGGELSSDAVPYLLPLLDDSDPAVRAEAGSWLRDHYERLGRTIAASGWPAYHVSAYRAYRLLDRRADELEQYDLPDVWSDYRMD
jgi:hypothetical protein